LIKHTNKNLPRFASQQAENKPEQTNPTRESTSKVEGQMGMAA